MLAVAVEDHQHLDGSAMAGDPVWRHRGELGGMAGEHEVLGVAQHQPGALPTRASVTVSAPS